MVIRIARDVLGGDVPLAMIVVSLIKIATTVVGPVSIGPKCPVDIALAKDVPECNVCVGE